jgi:pimeloyl-ACP methyl ester carboxylesterase
VVADLHPALAIERRGRGEPLVLIHGLGGSKAIWSPQIERLSGEREVIALDLPGFGSSEPLPPSVRPTAGALAESVADALATLGIERAHLAGNSLGAWVALEMARLRRARSLCLISPAGLWRKPIGTPRISPRPIASRLRPLVPHLLRSARVRDRMLRSTIGRPDRIGHAEAVALLQGWIDAPGYAAANEEMRVAIFEGLEEIDVPTTIAWGELDRLVRPPHPDRRPEGARFVVLPGCGHTPNWDDPELVAELLLEASAADVSGSRTDR